MSDFKHSLNLSGTTENKEKFVKDLIDLGYKYSKYCINDSNLRILSINHIGVSQVQNGEYGFYNTPSKREYEFNIDNENEYKTALAIAAIRGEDSQYHIGELFFNSESPDQLLKVRIVHPSVHSMGADSSFSICRESDTYYTTLSEGTATYWSRKATPDEIIKFFNTNKTNKMEDFKLPAKWIVRYKNKEEFDKLRNWKKNSWGYIDPAPYKGFVGGSYPRTDGNDNLYWTSGEPAWDRKKSEGHVEITFEQFEKYVLNTPQQGKKIIGYKTPMDLFGGAIKKGHIYSKPKEGNHWYSPSPITEYSYKNGQSLAAEIVEAWEAVYEELWITRTIGSNNLKVKILKGRIETEGKGTINIEEVKKLVEYFMNPPFLFKINLKDNGPNYSMTLADQDTKNIRIGCKDEDNRFSINELNLLITDYNKLNQ